MNIKELKEVLQLMADHNLSEIEIEKEGMKIRLKKGGNGRFVAENDGVSMMMPMQTPSQLTGANLAAPAQPKATEPENVVIVRSPMVGTFYSAPGPDQPVYVTPGKKVSSGDVLGIIEAMKLMNEIKGEITGTVLEVLVKNGQPVEFDQPLFKIQKG